MNDQQFKFDREKRTFVSTYTVEDMQHLLWDEREYAIANAFPNFTLVLSLLAQEGIDKVLAYGAQKYQRFSWRNVAPVTRYVDAFLRHALAVGEWDPETGLRHGAHAACNALFLAHHQAEGRLLVNDDGFFVDRLAPAPATERKH